MELKVPFRIKMIILCVNPLHPSRPFLPLECGRRCGSPSDSAFLPGVGEGLSGTLTMSSVETEFYPAVGRWSAVHPTRSLLIV